MAKKSIVAFDFSEASALGRKMVKIADLGLKGDALSSKQMNEIWKATAKQVIIGALPNAPKSGLSGESYWTKGKYSYVGMHGDLGRHVAYSSKVYRSGLGVRIAIGPLKRGSKFDSNFQTNKKGQVVPTAAARRRLAGITAKFAMVRSRRLPGGKATTSSRRDWLGDSNIRTQGKQAQLLVYTFNQAHERQLQKGSKT